MAGKRTTTTNADAGKEAAQPAAAAPAEQLAPQPAGSTQEGAHAPADTTGAAASAAASSEQTTANEAPAGAAPAVEGAGGNAGQEAHPQAVAEPAKQVVVVVMGTGAPSPLVLTGSLNGEGEYVVTLPRPLQGNEPSDTMRALIDSLGDGDIEGLFIRSVPEAGFRRCGMQFTPDGHGVALSALTQEQIEVLLKEPNLRVEPGTFSGLVE